jgi:hypothetical protein
MDVSGHGWDLHFGEVGTGGGKSEALRTVKYLFP